MLLKTLKSACIRKFRGRGTRVLTQLIWSEYPRMRRYLCTTCHDLAMSEVEERLLELPVMDIQPNWNETFRYASSDIF